MKRNIYSFYVLAFIIFTLPAYGQMEENIDIRNLSLKDALRYSLQSSPTQRVNELKVEESRLKLSQISITRIPDVYLSGDFRRNLIIPSTPVPASLMDSNAPKGETIYMKFNTDWNSSAGLNLSYDLFDPEKIGEVSEYKQQLKIDEYDAQLSRRNLRADVAMAYAECLIAQVQLQSLAADTLFYDRSLQNMDDLYQKQKASLVERNMAQTAFNESLSRYLQGEDIEADAIAKLLYLMGQSVTEENIRLLQLSEDIPALYETMVSLGMQNSSDKISLEEIRQNEIVLLAKNRIKFATWKYVPTLSLTGFYGTNYYANELSLTKNEFWRGNSFIGLTLKVPITQSLITANELSQLRVRQQMETENLRDIRNTRNREWLNEETFLKTRQKEYILRQENLKMSEQNLKAAEVQSNKGYILESELLSARLEFQNARQHYLQAAYDVFSSLIMLEKLR
ncbi:MAG: TolC family protein [Dysgonamonadaceae bacterium]|jgi:outer membrane protein TolC|nr:TolC family protein [Dysgonamonadaceae bacterium]MDD3356630.1 TolC family protein [Dysgonamonadaceae bacterium]MDD3727936.1 TolC family protein [Dysgonamonadaceae bacterium]MDD4246917.1 TolC family protein [Dysgonamonadaceae bacterium]MDD4605986.1 TolC family protein [Dysgonamonadaceae bacterium]